MRMRPSLYLLCNAKVVTEQAGPVHVSTNWGNILFGFIGGILAMSGYDEYVNSRSEMKKQIGNIIDANKSMSSNLTAISLNLGCVRQKLEISEKNISPVVADLASMKNDLHALRRDMRGLRDDMTLSLNKVNRYLDTIATAKKT